MKILILGGSYFFGRVFTMYASEKAEVLLFNRGTYSMAEFGVKEIQGNRKKEEDIKKIPQDNYDVVVDFCAYDKGDISRVASHLQGKIKQYIFISTVDVTNPEIYKGQLKKEDSPYNESLNRYPEEQRRYIQGKIDLEKELKEVAKDNFHYTIIRPAVIYGPYNYAPREAEFVRWMIQGGQIVLPENADMLYSMCYVKDAALLTLAACDEKAYNQTFILASENATGETIADLLIKASGRIIQKIFLPEGQLQEMGLAVPFGGQACQSQVYDGSKISELTGVKYTSLSDGLSKTYNAFAGVYGN